MQRIGPARTGLVFLLSCLPLGLPAGGAEPDAAPSAGLLRKLLRDELTQRWYPQMIDREHGGFHQNHARDWSRRTDESKFQVFQARMTWTASAYAEFDRERREEFLGYARHGLAFLDGPMRDREHGGFHWILGPDGKLDPRLGDEKHAYGTSFVIYAASKLRHVGGDDLALKVARDAFDWLDSHAHDAARGGYWEALRRDGTPITSWSPSDPLHRRSDRLGVYYGYKTMNSHIHLLEAVSELSRVDPRPVVKERLRELFEIVRDKIAIEPGALNLYLTPDWRAVPAHDSFGHDIETAYLLLEAADALGIPDDPRAKQVARSLVDHALDWVWDDEHGGFYDKGDSFAGQAYDTTKVWWTQAEGLNALVVIDRRFGRETDRYLQAFRKQWDFIEKHMIDPQYGGWFGETARDGALRGDGAKATPWKVNYHHSRAMMNVARMLEGGHE
ncbi:MAG: AGE family epimerase/isomerase [Isosphaeraceae bacterium]